MRKKPKKLELLQYALIGSILITTASSNLEQFPLVGYLTLTLGILVLCHFAYGMVKKNIIYTFGLTGSLVEGVALLLSAYIVQQNGKIYLPYVFLFASFGFFIAAGVHFFKIKKAAKPTIFEQKI